MEFSLQLVGSSRGHFGLQKERMASVAVREVKGKCESCAATRSVSYSSSCLAFLPGRRLRWVRDSAVRANRCPSRVEELQLIRSV